MTLGDCQKCTRVVTYQCYRERKQMGRTLACCVCICFMGIVVLASTVFRFRSILFHRPTVEYVQRLPEAECPEEAAVPPRVFVAYRTSVITDEVDRECVESWRCAGLNVTLLTDEFALDLITQHYPWLYEAYLSLPRNIMRVDVARIAALHHYGGVYSDSNICAHCEAEAKALERFSRLRQRCKVTLPKTYPIGYSNDFLISPRNHPFLMHFLVRIVHEATLGRYVVSNYLDVMARTGPLMLSQTAQNWPRQGDFHFLESYANEEDFPGASMDVIYMNPDMGSTWHEWDATLILYIFENYPKMITRGAFLCAVFFFWRRRHTSLGLGNWKSYKKS